MKKISLVVLPAITIALEILPLGAVCIFAPSPTERVKETFSYFSPIPFGYANFAPLITAVLTVVILLLSLISLKKNGVFNSMFVLSIITAVISLLPLVLGFCYVTFVGVLITMALVTECILIKTKQKYSDNFTLVCMINLNSILATYPEKYGIKYLPGFSPVQAEKVSILLVIFLSEYMFRFTFP